MYGVFVKHMARESFIHYHNAYNSDIISAASVTCDVKLQFHQTPGTRVFIIHILNGILSLEFLPQFQTQCEGKWIGV